MSVTWGNNIKISIFGENYEDGVGVNIDGLPSGYKIDYEEISIQMARCMLNTDQSLGNRKDSGYHKILSGISNDHLLGTPLCAIIKNHKNSNSSYRNNIINTNSSHNHFNKSLHYNYHSVNEQNPDDTITAPLTLAGSICRQILEKNNIKICAHIYSIGGINDTPLDPNHISSTLQKNLSYQAFPVIHHEIESAMKAEIDSAKSSQKITSGIIECSIYSSKKPIASSTFDGIKNSLSSIMFGIESVAGIEFVPIHKQHNLKPYGTSSSPDPIIFRVLLRPNNADLTIIPKSVPTIEATTAISVMDCVKFVLD